MAYLAISIPVLRLTEEWLNEHGYTLNNDLRVFIGYQVPHDTFRNYNSVMSIEYEFICNTMEEFIQKITEAKLERLIQR